MTHEEQARRERYTQDGEDEMAEEHSTQSELAQGAETTEEAGRFDTPGFTPRWAFFVSYFFQHVGWGASLLGPPEHARSKQERAYKGPLVKSAALEHNVPNRTKHATPS